MAGARQEDLSGAMISVLKKMDSMLESTNEIYSQQLSILNSIDTVQKSAVVNELQTQTKILQSIESKIDSVSTGGPDKGNLKAFKEAFGDIADVIEKLLKTAAKMDDKAADKLANFFNRLADSLNKFIKDIDASKVKSISDAIGGIAKGVFGYTLVMILATPLLIASLPGVMIFGLSLRLLTTIMGKAVTKENAEGLAAILGLAKGILLYSLVMIAVTILSPFVLIGSTLFGLSIRLLLATMGSAKKETAEGLGAILGLAKGILLYSLVMIAVTIMAPIIIIGSVLFGLSIRLLLLSIGAAKKEGVESMKAILTLSKGILLYVLAMIAVTLLLPIVLMGTLVLVGTFFLLSFGLKMMSSKKVKSGVMTLIAATITIFVLGLVLALFGKLVSFEDILKVGLAVAGLGLIFYVVGSYWENILKGALVMIAIGISLLIFSIGFAIFASAIKTVTWEHLGMMAATIGFLALIGTVLGVPPINTFAAAGAGILILLGAAFLVFSVGFLIFAGAIAMLDKDDPKMMGEAIYEIGMALVPIGLMSPLVILGAAAMVVAGAALLPITLGLGVFKASGFEKKDGDNLEYALNKMINGFLGGEMPGGIVASLKFAAQAAARAALLAVTAIPMMAAGAALIPITKALATFKESKFEKSDADALEYMLGSVVKAFGIVTDYDRQKKMGFYVNPVDLFLGIESLSGAGRVLAGLAEGVQAWANLEVNEWEVINGGTKDAKLVIKNRRKLTETDFQNAAIGMATVISAIAAPFAQVGRLEKGESSGNPVLDAIFSGGYVSAGIEALKKSGDTIVSLAAGVQSFANLTITEYEVVGAGTADAKLVPKSQVKMTPTDIENAAKNISMVIGVVANALADVGRMEANSEGFFADGYVNKGKEALGNIGENIKAISEAVIGFATLEMKPMELINPGTDKAKLVPGKPVRLTPTDIENAAKNLADVITLMGKEVSNFGKWVEENGGDLEVAQESMVVVSDVVSKGIEMVKQWESVKSVEETLSKITALYGGINTIFDLKKNPISPLSTFYFTTFQTNAVNLAKNANLMTVAANAFDRIAKSTKVIQTNVNGFDIKKLTLTDSLMRSIAAMSKNPEAIASMINEALENSFEELIKALKEMAAENTPSAASPTASPTAAAAPTTAAPTAAKPEEKKTPPSTNFPTTMDVRIINWPVNFKG